MPWICPTHGRVLADEVAPITHDSPHGGERHTCGAAVELDNPRSDPMTDPTPRSADDELPTHITPEQLVAACEALGITPKITRRFRIAFVDAYPHEVLIERYRLNERGAKYFDDETGEPAMETATILVGRKVEATR